MNGMMLHCGADALTRSELAALPAPPPMGPRHVIRPFIEDVELVQNEMAANGLTIKDEGFGVQYTKEGTPGTFFGLLELVGDRDDFGLMVGLRGSYNQRLPRGIAVGSRVFVCDNLAFNGEITISTKQTLNVADRLPGLMKDAVARIPQMAEAQESMFEMLRSTTIPARIGDAMLIEMVRRGVMVPSQLGRAMAEWDKPLHDEHAEDGFSLWRMHNAVTEAIKPSNPERAAVPATWERTTKLTGFLNEARRGGFTIYQH